MRVLHLLKSTKYSGAENVVLTIMSLFPEAEMIYASPDGPIRKVVEARGQKFYPLENTSVGAVRKAIRDLKPDLIHAHDFSMATCAAWAAGKTPVVAHFHNNPLWLKKICPQSVALALSLPRIRNVISVSNSIEAEYIFRGLLKQKKYRGRQCGKLCRCPAESSENVQLCTGRSGFSRADDRSEAASPILPDRTEAP